MTTGEKLAVAKKALEAVVEQTTPLQFVFGTAERALKVIETDGPPEWIGKHCGVCSYFMPHRNPLRTDMICRARVPYATARSADRACPYFVSI